MSLRSAPGRALAVALFAVALYAAALGNAFALDDVPLIRDNPFVRNLANVPRFFVSDYWAPRLDAGLYRPLTTTSYALNFALGGGAPFGYLLVNLLLHGACAALLLLWLERLTGQALFATSAALLFAAHAVHAEVLANAASGRPELLATALCLLALYLDAPRRDAPRRSVAAGLCFGLALLCKESAITVLALPPLVDALYVPRGAGGLRGVWRERATAYMAWASVAVAYLGVRVIALDEGGILAAERTIDNPLVALDPLWRWLNALRVALRYGALLLAPLELSYDRSFDAIPLATSLADPRLWLDLGIALLVAGALLWGARRSREVALGAAFALVTFSVVSNTVLPIGTILGERLLYLPSVGFCILLAALLVGAARRVAPRRVAPAVALATALLALAHGARGVQRVLDWRSENGLYVHDLSVMPGSVKIQSNAGAAYAELGRHEEALACFERAIAIAPDFPAPYRGAVLSLIALGRFHDARFRYDQTLRFGPPVPAVEEAIRRGMAGR